MQIQFAQNKMLKFLICEINVGFLAAFEISVDDVRYYTYIFSAFGEMRLPLNTIHRLMPCKYVKEYLHAGKRLFESRPTFWKINFAKYRTGQI